jgi:hypothetical protein
VLWLAGCGASAGPPVASGAIPLPTPNVAPIPLDRCAETPLDSALHGDQHDPLIAWIVDRVSHARRDVVWPPGYGARFTPGLEIVDPTGAIVLREGEAITKACGVTDDGRLYLAPPFR